MDGSFSFLVIAMKHNVSRHSVNEVHFNKTYKHSHIPIIYMSRHVISQVTSYSTAAYSVKLPALNYLLIYHFFNEKQIITSPTVMVFVLSE